MPPLQHHRETPLVLGIDQHPEHLQVKYDRLKLVRRQKEIMGACLPSKGIISGLPYDGLAWPGYLVPKQDFDR